MLQLVFLFLKKCATCRSFWIFQKMIVADFHLNIAGPAVLRRSVLICFTRVGSATVCAGILH